MGYYTDFELTAEKFIQNGGSSFSTRDLSPEELEPIVKEVEKLDVFESYDPPMWYGNAKWYDSDEDMLRLSCRFPDVLFTLSGEGEERDDEWYAYYLNGRMQQAAVTKHWNDFDPGLLSSRQFVDDGKQYSYEKYRSRAVIYAPAVKPPEEPEPASIDISDVI